MREMVVRAVDESGRLLLDRFMMVCHEATAQDWEEAAGTDRFVEFVDGILIMHSPVGELHARLFDFIYPILSMYVDHRKLGRLYAGPFTMELEHDRKFEPDVIFVSSANAHRVDEDRLHGPADVAIEIASPSTRAYDRREKRRWYAEGGVREYWMIDPIDGRVVVDRPAGSEALSLEQGRVESAICSGFWLQTEWLWRTPFPDKMDCLEAILRSPSE